MAYAGGAAAAEMEMAAKELAKAVAEVVRSSHFDRENILQRDLKLSQAYCLLWQDQESGEVAERMCSYQRNAGSAATVLLDLVALGRITIDVEPKKCLGISYTNTYVKVALDSLTETYLDDALFDEINKQHEKRFDHPKELKTWIRSDITKMSVSKKCAAVTLKSLVDLGILDEKKKFIGRKFPTVNPEPEKRLVNEIRKVALEDAVPDSYMRALLTVMRAVDDLYVLRDPFLKKHFTGDEYKIAKKRIKALVGLGKNESAKYEAM